MREKAPTSVLQCCLYGFTNRQKNNPTVDTHVLVVGFRERKKRSTHSSKKGACFSKTRAQTQRLILENITIKCLETNVE